MDGLLRQRFEPLVFGEIRGFTLPIGLEPWGRFSVLSSAVPGVRFGDQWLLLTRRPSIMPCVRGYFVRGWRKLSQHQRSDAAARVQSSARLKPFGLSPSM